MSEIAEPAPAAEPSSVAEPAPAAESARGGRQRRGGRHRRTRRRLSGWLTLLGWIGIGLLAIVALMRIFAWDDLEPFALLNTFSILLYLPAWFVAIVAVAGRRYVLAAAALLIVAVQLALVLPELTAAQPAPQWAAHAPTLRLLDANVYYLNPSMAGYAREIQQYKPQLVTMEEATTREATMLEHSSSLRALPYRIDIARDDPKAFFIASAYPLHEQRVIYSGGVPLIVEATIELPSGPQTLWVVHTDAITDSIKLWKSQLTLIAKLVRAHSTNKLLVVGDFNATWGSKGFREILGDGMTDGAAARGRALDMTWSQTEGPLPPFVRIDHVLTGPGVAVTSIRTGDGPGSDHRDLMATVAVRR